MHRYENTLFFTVVFICQLIAISIWLNLILITKTGIVFNDRHLYKGDMFFTGEINGFLYMTGCDSLGSVSKRAHILKKFKDYLYFDAGNITSPNQVANSVLISNLKTLDITAINLTENDIINLSEENIKKERNIFISANNVIPLVPKFKKIPFVLKSNNNKTKIINVFVTGIAKKQPFFSSTAESISSNDLTNETAFYLNELYMEAKDSDIKVLLFNEDFIFLEETLRKTKIRFDMVVCTSSPYIDPNNTVTINDVLIIYPDRYGRSIARCSVYFWLANKKYELEYIKLFKNIPDDPDTDKLIIKMTGART